jgi:hypothetical protein
VHESDLVELGDRARLDDCLSGRRGPLRTRVIHVMASVDTTEREDADDQVVMGRRGNVFRVTPIDEAAIPAHHGAVARPRDVDETPHERESTTHTQRATPEVSEVERIELLEISPQVRAVLVD